MQEHINDINHPGHNHQLLVLKLNFPKREGICSACNQVLHLRYSVDIYDSYDEPRHILPFYCPEKGCEYYLHPWCALLGYMVDYCSDQIDHPLHPQHPLTLHPTSGSYPPPNNDNNNNGQTQTDHHQFVCSFCKQTKTSGFLLHCAHCDFYLDYECAYGFEKQHNLQSLSQYEFQHFFHENHTLLPRLCSGFSNNYGRCQACSQVIGENDLVLKCSDNECKRYNLHVYCSRVPKEMKHPFHPQHTLTLLQRPLPPRQHQHEQEQEQELRCSACHGKIKDGAFFLNCNQCPRGFTLDMQCAFLNPTVKDDRHDHHLLARYNLIDVKDALCAACNTLCLQKVYRCFTCNFNIHKECLSLPLLVDYEDHVHPFTLVNSLNEDKSGTYYCDVCEETREPNHGLYSCVECPSFVAHFECVLPPSYTKGERPWMRRQFIQESTTLALTSDEKQLVSQLDTKIVTMGIIVRELLWERRRENVTPKLDVLEDSYAEAEGMLRQLRELIKQNAN